MSAADEIRTWLKSVMAREGWSARDWAGRSGVAPSTIQRAIKDDYQFVTSSRTLEKLAHAANVQPPTLARRDDSPQIQPTFLPVRYRVQAGHWAKVDDVVQVFPAQFPVSPDLRYEGIDQWLEEVVGDSVNKLIPDGHYAHVIDAIGLGYAPRGDDIVVVERHRAHERERSIKQVAFRRGVIELWPRSTNPNWSEPLQISQGTTAGEEYDVQIVGLVVGSYRRF